MAIGASVREDRKLWPSMRSGALGLCPNCASGRLFRSYLKVADTCPRCGEALHHHRADEAPPYFTIFIVGHLVVPLMLLTERLWEPALWIHLTVFGSLTLALCLALLPIVKGATVGFQWAHRMHGFELEDPRSSRS